MHVYNAETKLSKLMYKKLLQSDEKSIFYTNIDKIEFFNLLHTKIAPLVLIMQNTRRLDKTKPKTSGPDAKLESKDEIR